MQAEGGLERRANGKWKWKMEIVKGMEMKMKNAGYLPEVALAPLLTKASSATPAVAQEEEWKKRRGDGKTGGRVRGGYLRVGATQTRKPKRE